MDRLDVMAYCKAPLNGSSAPSSGGAGNDGASATGGGNFVALLAAAAKKRPMEKLVATMAFCEAPLDGTFDGTTSALSSVAAVYGTASSGNVVASLAAATKKRPMEKLVATMAFCEAPFDGTFDGTSAPSASRTNVPEAGGGGEGEGEDAAALRRSWLANARKHSPLPSHRLLREKAGAVVDGLAIFEAVALQ